MLDDASTLFYTRSSRGPKTVGRTRQVGSDDLGGDGMVTDQELKTLVGLAHRKGAVMRHGRASGPRTARLPNAARTEVTAPGRMMGAS